jgi:hypothetical protein
MRQLYAGDMDEARTRDVVDAHAQAVVRGDMDAVVADLSEELQPQADEITRAFPLPVTDADVLSLEIGAGEAVAEIRYAGERGELTVRTRWEQLDGRPRIVYAEPIAD